MTNHLGSQKTILVIDDDDIFRETLCSGLESDFTIIPAGNAKEAIQIINRITIDLILTDVRMPGMSGYELLEWLNDQSFRTIPYIVMTGYPLMADGEASESPLAFKTVTKPFKLADLKLLIQGSLIKEKDGDKSFALSRYCKVPISDLEIRPVLDFDIYVQLSEQNFVKVAYKNEPLPLAQIKKFRQKGIDFLYIRTDDFHKFVQFAFDLAAQNSVERSAPKNLAFMDFTHRVLMEKIYVEGLAAENLEMARFFVQLSIGAITESNELLTLLEILKDTDEQIVIDSVAAAFYSVLIAKELTYESALTDFRLCMAGLFQDVGKKEIEKDLVNKSAQELLKKESEILESHVLRSQKILESVKFVNSDVIRIIQEHHEDLEGKGYPFGKKRGEQHPLSRILQCSNLFIEKVNAEKANSKKIDVCDVLSNMESKFKARLDRESVTALRNLFRTPARAVDV